MTRAFHSTSRPRRIREWAGHFVVYGFGTIALNALSFLVVPIYTHRIAPAEYGVLEMLNRGQEILVIVVMSGLGLAALAFHQFESENPDKQKKVFSTALLGVALNAALLFSVLCPFSDRISVLLFGNEKYAWAVRAYLVLLSLEVIFQIGLTALQAEFRSRAYVCMSAGRFALGLVANLVLVLWLKWGLRGIIASSLLHSALSAAAVAVYPLRRAGWSFSLQLLGKMARYGLPFIPGGFFLFILNSGDRYFLNALHGVSVTGIYGLSYKISTIVMLLLLTPFLNLWGPSMVGVARAANGPQRIAQIATYLSAAYCYAGLLLALLTPALLRWISGPKYWSAREAIPVIILAYFFWVISVVADTVFYVEKKTAVKPLILCAACVICFSLYALLIPRYAAMGAATATVLAFAFFAWLTMWVGRRYLKIPYEWLRLGALLLMSILIYGAGRLASRLAPEWAITIIAAILFPLLLTIMRFWSPAEKSTLQQIPAKLRSYLRAPWLETTTEAEAEIGAPLI